MAGLVSAFQSQVNKSQANRAPTPTAAPSNRLSTQSSSVPTDQFGIPLYGRPAGPYGDIAQGNQLGRGAGSAIANAARRGQGSGTTTITREFVDPRRMNEVADLYNRHYQPQFDALDAEVQWLAQQHGARGAQAAAERDAIRAQGGLAKQMAQFDNRAAQIQIGNMPTWRDYLAKNFGVVLREGKSNLDALVGLRDDANANRLYDQIDVQQARENLVRHTGEMRDDALTDASVRGAIGTVQKDWDQIQGEADARNEAITQQDRRSGTAHKSALKELDQRKKAINFDLERANLSYGEQVARLKEREDLLRLEAERARVNEQKAAEMMNAALRAAKAAEAVSTGQFLEALHKADAQRQALLFEKWTTAAEAMRTQAGTQLVKYMVDNKLIRQPGARGSNMYQQVTMEDLLKMIAGADPWQLQAQVQQMQKQNANTRLGGKAGGHFFR